MPGPVLPDAHGTPDVHAPNQAAEHNLTNPERGVKSEIEQSPNGAEFFHRWGKNGENWRIYSKAGPTIRGLPHVFPLLLTF